MNVKKYIHNKKIIGNHTILKNQEQISIIHQNMVQIKSILRRIIQEKIWN